MINPFKGKFDCCCLEGGRSTDGGIGGGGGLRVLPGPPYAVLKKTPAARAGPPRSRTSGRKLGSLQQVENSLVRSIRSHELFWKWSRALPVLPLSLGSKICVDYGSFLSQVAEFQDGIVTAEGRVSLLILDLENGSLLTLNLENGSPWTRSPDVTLNGLTQAGRNLLLVLCGRVVIGRGEEQCACWEGVTFAVATKSFLPSSSPPFSW